MVGHIENMVDGFTSGRLTRRQLVARIGAFAAGVAGAERVASAIGLNGPLGQDAASSSSDDKKVKPTFQSLGLNHIALRVSDVPRSRDWYVRHLGLKVTRDNPRSCFLDCGEHFLALFRNDKPGLDHYCYTIRKYDPDRVVKTLKGLKMKPRRAANRVYFDDPDGIEVQVSGREV